MFSTFKDYLTEKSLASAKYVPLYIRWLSDCYADIERQWELHTIARR